MSHQTPLFSTVPCKSFLANHAILATINNLLMMKFQSCGHFWTAPDASWTPEFPDSRALVASGGLGGGVLGALLDHLVHNAPLDRHVRGQEVVALQRVLDLLERLAGMLHVNLVEAL